MNFIRMKLNARPIVAKSLCFPPWESGINSSTTKYTIAPAANDNK